MDEIENVDFPEFFTHFEFSLKITRVINNLILPSTLKFKMEFIAMDEAEEEHIDNAFTKMKYWIDNIANKSVVFCHENDVAIQMFIDTEKNVPRVGNVLMITPDEPDDQHLAAIFQAKLQALSGEVLAFGPVEVRSDNQLGVSFTFVGDSSSVLPEMTEWVGERTYFDMPWWDRDDASTVDTIPADDADLSVKPQWAFSLDFLIQKDKKQAGVIIRPQFNPTIIDGGKVK